MKQKKQMKRVPHTSRHLKPPHMTLEEWQIQLRREEGQEKKMRMENTGEHPALSDFLVTDPATGGQYRIAIRSPEIGWNYCACRDFATNTLGTCEHIEYVLHVLKRKPKTRKALKEEYRPPYSSLFLRYGRERVVMFRIGNTKTSALRKLAAPYVDVRNALKSDALDHIEHFIEMAKKIDPTFRCYDDALAFIIAEREKRRREKIFAEKYADGAKSTALDTLLTMAIYPYQKEGILFAARAGRCLIADDMGLGKTIQAIGCAELLARELHIDRVLIVCPTSLTYQWKKEIEAFTGRTARVITGDQTKRREQYGTEEFFTITSYHQAVRDKDLINAYAPDLLILDESQKIKNWQTRTAQTIKGLISPYVLLLSGTPLENRLEELHSLIECIDPHHLGPLFRFLQAYQVTDDGGKVVGYQNLHEIKTLLKPLMIRRTKRDVLQQLPERTDKHFLVPVTPEQMAVHDDYRDIVVRLVAKWRRFKFLNEQDRHRLMISLNCMRMVSDSTFIIDQKTRFDTKIAEMFAFLADVLQNKEEKVVIFSQWERMTRLVAEELTRQKIGFVNLHGGIPGKDRRHILEAFHDDPHCRIFLSTDAGGIGLNLQNASTVVNLDCPWNPAVLEQRIGRVHRHGQRRNVLVAHFISKGTIEESLLKLLSFKKSLFDGVLDSGESSITLEKAKLTGFMKTVEQVTDTLPTPTEVAAAFESAPPSPALASEKGNQFPSPTAPAPSIAPDWDSLITIGVNILKTLQAPTAPSSGNTAGSSPSPLTCFVHRDETGKRSLKIPLDDPAFQAKAGNLLKAIAEFVGR